MIAAALVDRLAEDVGRLRRRIVADEYSVLLGDRIAATVQALDAMLQPTAADLYAENLAYCGDAHVAVGVALADTEARDRRVIGLLGEKAPR